jgi:hypothetical protein
MFDVILISVAALFQLGATIYSVDIAVRENRRRNAVVIGGLGLVAIILTIWAGYDAYVSQENLTGEITQIRKQLSNANVALVNIGLKPSIQNLSPEGKLQTFMLIGVQAGVAKNMQCWFDIFTLPGDAVAEQNRQAISRFRQKIASEDQPTGEDRIEGTGCYRELTLKLTESEISELVETNGTVKRIVYLMALAKWKNDANAEFHTEACKWMEPPKTRTLVLPGWHDCSH